MIMPLPAVLSKRSDYDADATTDPYDSTTTASWKNGMHFHSLPHSVIEQWNVTVFIHLS